MSAFTQLLLLAVRGPGDSASDCITSGDACPSSLRGPSGGPLLKEFLKDPFLTLSQTPAAQLVTACCPFPKEPPRDHLLDGDDEALGVVDVEDGSKLFFGDLEFFGEPFPELLDELTRFRLISPIAVPIAAGGGHILESGAQRMNPILLAHLRRKDKKKTRGTCSHSCERRALADNADQHAACCT